MLSRALSLSMADRRMKNSRTDFAPGAILPKSTRMSVHGHSELEPISVPERIGAVILMGTALLIGLYPRLLLDLIVPSFSSPLFEWLPKGGPP